MPRIFAQRTTCLCIGWMLTVAFLTVVPFSRADKIFLKDGTVLSGEISSETDDVVRIVIVTGTIRDTKTVNKVSIERVERSTPEDFAYEMALSVLPAAEGLTVNEYDQLINRAEDFLTKYPESSRGENVKKVVDQLKEERGKVEIGFRKFRSEWLSPSQQLSHRINMEADQALSLMRSAVAGSERGWHLVALRVFERMEKDFQGTLAYPESIEMAQAVLPKYGGYLQNEIQFARFEISKRQKAMAGMSDFKRSEYQALLSQEDKRFAARLKAEQDSGLVWTTVDLLNESSIKSAVDRVRKEIDRLAKIDLAPLRQQAEMIFEVENFLAAEDVVSAKTKLEDALKIKGGVSKGRDSNLKVLAAIESKLAQVEEKVAKEKALAERQASEASKVAEAMSSGGDGTAAEEGDAKPMTAAEAMAQINARKAAAAKAEEEKKAEKKKPTPKPSTAATASTSASGGGFNPLFLLPVLLIGATIGIYLLDKKKKAAAAEAEEAEE